MRDGWYSDDRDLLKWATLTHLADREQLRSVVQVAMFRPSKRMTIETASGPIGIPDLVWSHFRDIRGISPLGEAAGLKISIIDAPFAAQNRVAYFTYVAKALRDMPDAKAVLLDPDTGFEPQNPNSKHVTAADVRTTWDALAEQDWLLLYQHRWHQTQWKEDAKAKFASACGVPNVETFQASKMPSDVILLAAHKTGTSGVRKPE